MTFNMANIRGRLEGALAGEIIDHPVYAVYDWFVKNRPAVDWETLFNLGLGQINHANPIRHEQTSTLPTFVPNLAPKNRPNPQKQFPSRKSKRRFPLLPGAHVVCAAKEYTAPGPKYIWSAIAISIAEDRTADSCLFIEDADEVAVKDAKDLTPFADDLLHKIATCAVRCGEDSQALYKEIWISYRIKWIPEGYVGCAPVAAPYLVLAKDALPDGKPEGLLNMTLSDWEKKIIPAQTRVTP